MVTWVIPVVQPFLGNRRPVAQRLEQGEDRLCICFISCMAFIMITMSFAQIDLRKCCRLVLSATRTSSGYQFSGRSTHVQDADSAAWLLVTAETDNGVVQALIDPTSAGLTVTPLDSLDITRSFAEVELDGLEVPAAALVGEGDARELVEQQLAVACVLTTAESVGAMDHDFEMALQYAKDRIAFGRPIGSFQAIKHLLADTSLMLEMSKAITLAAANSVGTDDGYGLEAASMAKAFVGDCGIDLAQNCFQVFGGIGFTWEHDQHLYLRRVTTDSALFGGPAWHRERLCQLSGL